MRYIAFLILFLLSMPLANSQHWCGTMQDDDFMQNLVDNKEHWDETMSRSSQARFTPVTIHLVGRDDGTGRFSEELANRAMCLLNERFFDLGTDMHFYVKDFNIINATRVFDNPRDNIGFMRSAKDRNSMNIFVVNQISTGPTGTTLGFFTGGINDFIVMRAQNFGDASFTLEHELGHFFTLAHTHRGWEDVPWNPNDTSRVDAITISSSQSAPVQIELADGSNCDTAADFLCDTPADYGSTFLCGCCTAQGICRDRNGDEVTPMNNNIMSYSANCDDWAFTPNQVTAMQASYDSPNRAFLRTAENDVTEFTPIVDSITGMMPEQGAMLPQFDRVELSWDPVANADYYEVVVRGEAFRTEETSFVVTTLSPNSFPVVWSVRAFNIFGGGCSPNAELFFGVGSDMTSAVNNIDFVSDVNIFPNPAQGNSNITVSFDSGSAFTGTLSLYNINGQLVSQDRNVRFNGGDNRHNISLNGISSGIHILEIQTDRGTVVEKLIID